jgi:hypothetical protein
MRFVREKALANPDFAGLCPFMQVALHEGFFGVS